MRFLVLCALMLSSQAFANILDEGKYAVGGGFNFSKPDTDESLGDDVDEVWRADLAVGLKALLPINEKFSFRTGLYLQQKSATYDVDIDGFEGEVAAKIIYLSLPITAQYELNENLALYGGYILDYSINDYCSVSGDFDTCTLDESAKQTGHLATLGGVIHASENWDIEFGYQHGLTDVYDDLKLHTIQLFLYRKFN